LWGGIGSLLLIGVALVGITQGWFFGDDAAAEETVDDTVTAAAETPVEPETTAPRSDPFANVSGAAPTAEEPTTTESNGGVTAASEASAGGATPAPAPPRKERDPMSVDLAGLSALEKLPETSDEDWAQYEKDSELLIMERGGKGTINAQRRLIEAGRPAVPAIVNAFRTMDFSTDSGNRAGDFVQRTLQDIANGKNLDWKYDVDNDSRWFNRRVVVNWHKIWSDYGLEEDRWMKFTGLDSVEADEAPSDEAAQEEGE
ncbi:MAG: hypothetical protein ACYTFV_04320, partial [Planctomycetota bacterium]